MCEFIYNENMRWIETVGMCFGVRVAWSSHELLPNSLVVESRMNRMNVCSFMLFLFFFLVQVVHLCLNSMIEAVT